MRHRVIAGLLALAAATAGSLVLDARVSPDSQDACRAPALPASTLPNIFTPAQESDLGDAVAERVEPSLRIIEDADLNTYLRRIGGDLVSHLPQNGLRITFSLVDLPEANAFVLPGGHVFVTRKLVGFTQAEDELAGVLGHELGHLAARQQSVALTRQMADVIGVSEVGNRDDIFEKYNRLMDNAARKPGAFKRGAETDKDQIEADRLGIFVVTAAGYDPQAHVRLFDRFAETQGNTGSFLSQLFGTTSPDAKRLGEMIRTTAAMPAGCKGTAHDPEAYKAWQRKVLTYSGLGRKESLAGVISRKALTPPLRGEVNRLRFSPDGRFILAQDDAGISVLSREPLASLFRIPAADAEPAHFTQDSSAVVFFTPDLRVERWSVAARQMEDVRDLVRHERCAASELSPDGRMLACVDGTFMFWLLDVQSGSVLFQKKMMNVMAFVSDSPLAFSPDGRFVVAGYRGLALGGTGVPEANAVIYDVQAKKPVSVKYEITRLLSSTFAFLAPDKVIALDPDQPAKSAIFKFPSGDIIERLELSRSELDAASKGNYVMLRPFQKYAVGVLNLTTKLVVKGNPAGAFDLHDDVFVAERGTGEIGLYAVEGNRVLGSVTVPASEFGSLRAAAVSPDLSWIALSDSTRGGIWNIPSGSGAGQLRGFRGASFDAQGALIADMPKTQTEPRSLTRIDTASRQVTMLGEIKDRRASQVGRFLMIERPLPANSPSPTGAEFELRDVARTASLWTRSFPKDPPQVWVSPDGESIVFAWAADSSAGRDRIRADETLQAKAKADAVSGDYVVEVLNTEQATVRARLLVETGKGSFRLRGVIAAGDWALVLDSLNRVLVYSLKTGDLKGYAFGSRCVVNAASGTMAIDLGGGRMTVHDLTTMRRLRDYAFANPVEYAAFSQDGGRLFVLTSDQTAYVMKTRPE
ncbi:MAG TPA: M48 family metalloprotease [Vicinamibacterales bacterium]|nr:M48 family metalloprotease [Vicinamibacterales bacterium]